MITNLHIKNFKCHKDTNLALGNLTLLCGQNGVGKSSAIQSLLLLRQSFLKNTLETHLSLNKPLCYIGNGIDALHKYHENPQISFDLTINSQIFNWVFGTKNHEKLEILEVEKQNNTYKNKSIALFGKDFQFISAARNTDYERNDYEVIIQKQISLEEGKAELMPQFLGEYASESIIESLAHPNEVQLALHHQAEAWENEISKGIKIILEKNGDNYEIRYNHEISNHLEYYGNLGTDAKEIMKHYTQTYSARNVGFGISYSLPVIVAILSAKKGALILIENPEAHLHPYGQAKLAELMCIAAQAGIQIIVETHSDHIVNGVLVQCKRFEQAGKGVNRENVRIHYFERAEDSTACNTTEVEILEGGRITYPPVGFFDQISKDRKTLMGF